MGCVSSANRVHGNSSSRCVKESPEEQLTRELWDNVALLEIAFLNSFFSSIEFMELCERAVGFFPEDPDEVNYIFLEYVLKTEASFFGNLEWIQVLTRIFEHYQSEQEITLDREHQWCLSEDEFNDYCQDYLRWVPARFALIFVDRRILNEFILQHQVLPSCDDRVFDSISKSIGFLTDSFTVKHTRSTVLDFKMSSKHQKSQIHLQDFLNYYITSSLSWGVCEHLFLLHVCYIVNEELCVPLGCYEENEESSIASHKTASQTLVVDNNPDSDIENDGQILEESVNMEKNQLKEDLFCDRLIRSLAPRKFNEWHKSRRSVCVYTEDSCSDNSSFKESSPRSESRVWFPKYHPSRNANARRRGYSFPSEYKRKEGYENKEFEMTPTTVTGNPEHSVTQSRPWTTNKSIMEIFSETGNGSLSHLLRDTDLKDPALEQRPGGGFIFKRAVPSISSSPPAFSEPLPVFQPRKETKLHKILTDHWADTPLTNSFKKSKSFPKTLLRHRGIDCDGSGNVCGIPRGDFKARTPDGTSRLMSDNLIKTPGTFGKARSCNLMLPRRYNELATSSSLDGSPESVTSSLFLSPTPLYSVENAFASRQDRRLGVTDKMREIPRTGVSGPTLV